MEQFPELRHSPAHLPNFWRPDLKMLEPSVFVQCLLSPEKDNNRIDLQDYDRVLPENASEVFSLLAGFHFDTLLRRYTWKRYWEGTEDLEDLQTDVRYFRQKHIDENEVTTTSEWLEQHNVLLRRMGSPKNDIYRDNSTGADLVAKLHSDSIKCIKSLQSVEARQNRPVDSILLEKVRDIVRQKGGDMYPTVKIKGKLTEMGVSCDNNKLTPVLDELRKSGEYKVRPRIRARRLQPLRLP
ncbi:MAG TPA: hypothetical protein VMM56_03570 [Planctomycetaceae bacterium]|nr:hypothetical protein [Planctomycetaceae bacterium]